MSALTRASLARTLESSGAAWPGAALLSSAYGVVSRRGVRRPLEIPAHAYVIGVGGATLGGSGKTPVAIAIAEALARRGERVAFVGHAYRASPRVARVVAISDDVREVGDEALLAARKLAPCGVEVIVSSTRQASVAFAAGRAKCMVVEGLLQTQPFRLARSVLALDAQAPWGNARFPPSGDLRAPRDALLEATDVVALVRDDRGPEPIAIEGGAKPTFEVIARVDRAHDSDGRAIAVDELASCRVGLLLTVARPQRIADALSRRGIHPVATVAFGDHDQPARAELDRATATAPPVDAWLTTAKCATKLPTAVRGAPLWALDYQVELPNSLILALLDSCCLGSSPGQKPW